MNDEIILMGNILASIFHSVYYCLFISESKKIKNKKIYFIMLTIVDYLIAQNIIKFKLGINADLFLLIVFYVNLKFLYKDKARITDLITFILADTILGIISVIIYFIFGMNFFSLIVELTIPILIVILFGNKLNVIDQFYNKFWNRKRNKVKIKSITVRGFSFCITVFEFLALHFWMIYLLLK